MDKNKSINLTQNINNNFDDKNISKQELNGHTNTTNQMIPKDLQTLQNDVCQKISISNLNNEKLTNMSEIETTNHCHSIFVTNDSETLLPTELQPEQSPTNSNSTDNLSYSSDNNYIEELLLLQSTLSEDEDGHVRSVNSDDCIYAYRGGDLDQLVQNQPSNNSNMEDETDFLEMDFDPDPLSEIEQENQLEVFDQIEFENVILLNEQRLNHNDGIVLSDIVNIQQNNCVSAISASLDGILIEDNINMRLNEKNELKCNGNLTNNILAEIEIKNDTKTIKPTGAKPKKINENKYFNNISTNSNNTTSTNKSRKCIYQKQKSLECDGNIKKFEKSKDLIIEIPKTKTICTVENNSNDCSKDCLEEITCLDCLEKEFLQTTVGKIIDNVTECLKCKFKKNNIYCCDNNNDRIKKNVQQQQQQQQQSQHKENDHHEKNDHKPSLIFKYFNDQLTSKEFNIENQRRTSCDNINNDDMLLRMTNNEISTISSINLDAGIIVQALDKINVTYDAEIINQYFNENTRTEFKNVGDFILYSSKKNCNFKKIIKLIKLASKDQLHIDFNYDDNLSSFEVVQVKTYDIIQCWIRHNDLTNLKKLNKSFFEMNILGKVINLIRQGISKQPLKEFMLIPQYYKSGFITITKNIKLN